jgi:hypothetical protein
VNVHAGLKSRVFVEGKWPLVLATLAVATSARDDVVAKFEPILAKLP